MAKHDPEAVKRFQMNRSADSLWRSAKAEHRDEAKKLGADGMFAILNKAGLESAYGACDKARSIFNDKGPDIAASGHAPVILRDTRGIRVRTMAGKLSRHGERPTLSNSVRTQADGTTQIIVYDPSRDYVDMHGAFVALRDKDVKALPPKLRRAYERAKHRASIANNVKPE